MQVAAISDHAVAPGPRSIASNGITNAGLFAMAEALRVNSTLIDLECVCVVPVCRWGGGCVVGGGDPFPRLSTAEAYRSTQRGC